MRDKASRSSVLRVVSKQQEKGDRDTYYSHQTALR